MTAIKWLIIGAALTIGLWAAQPAHAQAFVRGYFCSTPEAVVTLNEVLVSMSTRHSMKEAFRRARTQGAVCSRLSGIVVPLGVHSEFNRSDGRVVEIYEYAAGPDRKFSWITRPRDEVRHL